jgi:RNA polymerase-binding protein DksA
MALTDRQLAQLRAKLEARRAQLLAEAQQGLDESATRSFAATPDRPIAESGDESVADEEEDLNLAMIGRDVNELHDIDGALARMDDGTYGQCTECGGEIPFARLEAYPTATRCVRDQEIYERTHAGRGMPTL